MTTLRLDRLERLRAAVGSYGVDHLRVEPSVDFRYLTSTSEPQYLATHPYTTTVPISAACSRSSE